MSVDMAFEHAWSWFQLHASQRLQMVNFWLVSVAFISTAYVGAVANDLFLVAIGVAVVGALVSLCFYRLERRTRQLVHLAEPVLLAFQRRLARDTGIPEFEIVGQAETQKVAFSSYGSIIRLMQWLVTGAFVTGAVGAGVAMLVR